MFGIILSHSSYLRSGYVTSYTQHEVSMFGSVLGSTDLNSSMIDIYH